MRFVNILLFLAIITTFGCKKDPIGYLVTENASYSIKTLDVYKLDGITEDDPLYYEHETRIKHQSPWVSLTIDGVLGTNPINYEIAGVTASEGGDAEIFKTEVTVTGGGKVNFPFIYKSPVGKYLISIKVINEGHQRIVNDALTVVIH